MIASSGDIILLPYRGFQYNYSHSENERIHANYNCTLSHFEEKIALEEITSVAGLVPNSFCRYFKSRTGRRIRSC
jgi:transcriptional regulator GlxA family with amidase domain